MLALRDDEDAPPTPTVDVIMDDVIIDIVGESDSMCPPLSFDILSGFVSRSNDVLAFSSMDLSIFEYSPISFIDDINACVPCNIPNYTLTVL